MTEVVIASAARTPIGALRGKLKSLKAHEIGAIAISAALERAGVAGEEIDDVIMGQVLTAAAGMNPARQAARAAGIADEAPAMLVNQVCGSGLRAVGLAAQQIALGDAGIVVAGGQESMTNAPHAAVLRHGAMNGQIDFIDTMMLDGLTDAFFGYPMGRTAENVAHQYGLGREAQDAFGLRSQQKASQADRDGRFAEEIAAVSVAGPHSATIVDHDEYIRHDASEAGFASLKPAFAADGTVTAGNSSGVNDGAAALVLMSKDAAHTRGVDPLARIVAWGQAGLAPEKMGLGPIPASRRALAKAGWSTSDVDLWEINEAFAAQSLAVIRDLEIEPERVNVNGGAIALGHPIGASGARVLVTLVHELKRRNARKGVATVCIGGGMGIALCVERA